TSPRALAGGHRPKRSVASIAQNGSRADTRGLYPRAKMLILSKLRETPHPDCIYDAIRPLPQGERCTVCAVTLVPRHCERSESVNRSACRGVDCCVALLLAMTTE